MSRKIFRFVAQALLAAIIAFVSMMLVAYYDLPLVPEAGGTAAAAGQASAAQETVGQTEEALRSLDLTGELDSGKGRPLRMRKITVQPGGASPFTTTSIGLPSACTCCRAR